MSPRTLAAAALVAVALAGVAGPAHADTFVELAPAPTSTVAALPSAEVPNADGSLLLPPGWTDGPSMPAAGRSYAELQELWGRAGSAYGIPWQVLAAINKIETNFGANMGPSSAGAVGWMQFMPGTWLRWGLDADGDGIADPWNAEDAVHAAARYLAAAGGAADLERAVFAYNHADWYVQDVLALAAAYGGGVVPDMTFSADRLRLRIDQAEALVAAQEARIGEAVLVARRLARIERRLLTRASRARLLSDELALRRRAGEATAERAAADEVVASLRLGLGEAEAALAAAHTGIVPGAAPPPDYLSLSLGEIVGTPHTGTHTLGNWQSDNAYDIAVPEGTEIRADFDGVVTGEVGYLRDPHDTGRFAGQRLTLEGADNAAWYGHLSEVFVVPGESVVQGQVIGLSGSASGVPHLHVGYRFLPSSAGPASSGGYVFPVGGGPAVVSVSHFHHDYPAADIAAPQGAPVYALADALVQSSSREDAGRCGVGATIETVDGQTWTYCHLSYLDPAVEPGTTLPAGALVGLVGSTGHSTGPHLHLQLSPTSSYPQDQEWFRSFVGTAFAWQDADPGRVAPGDTASAPLFAMIPEANPGSDVHTFSLTGAP